MLKLLTLLEEWALRDPHRCRSAPGLPFIFVLIDGQLEPLRPFPYRNPVLLGYEQCLLERAVRQAIAQKPDLTLTIHLRRKERSFYEVHLYDPTEREKPLTFSTESVDLCEGLLQVYLMWLTHIETEASKSSDSSGNVTVL